MPWASVVGGGGAVGPPPELTDGIQAATLYGWGLPIDGDEFNGSSLNLDKWYVIDGVPGHNGNGRRMAAQVTVSGGKLTITGSSSGDSGCIGMYANPRTYGRWEVRMRVLPGGDHNYHPVLILFPSNDVWPGGGELDYAEAGGADALGLGTNYLYSPDGTTQQWTHSAKWFDLTQWHNYAAEWTSEGIRTYIDGQMIFRDLDPVRQPPGPMKQTIQLDLFATPGTFATTGMEAMWVRMYSTTGSSYGTPPTFAGFSDTFTTLDLYGVRWQFDPTRPVTADGSLNITPTGFATNADYNLHTSTLPYNLVGSTMTVEMASRPNAGLGSIQGFWTLGPTWYSNIVGFRVEGSTLSAIKQVAASETVLVSVTYNATNHRWQRIRESGGTVFFEVSSDGSSWNSFASTANPFTLTSCYLQLGAGYWNGSETPPFGTLVIGSVQGS